MPRRPLAGQFPACRAPAGGEQASGSPVRARRSCMADMSESLMPGALVPRGNDSLEIGST
jgi:hypothetical protein